jgi:hypothetical protein
MLPFLVPVLFTIYIQDVLILKKDSGAKGLISSMQETRVVKAIHSWKPISKRPKGRPKTSWEGDAKKDIQKLKMPDWRTLAQDRRRWKELVEEDKTLH